jgi:hypothetical protein
LFFHARISAKTSTGRELRPAWRLGGGDHRGSSQRRKGLVASSSRWSRQRGLAARASRVARLALVERAVAGSTASREADVGSVYSWPQ